MLAPFPNPRVPKTWRPKALKFDVFGYPAIVSRFLAGNPHEYPYKTKRTYIARI